MNKQEFVALLGKRLKSIYGSDVDERISFYCEIIDDKIEEGLSEEEAVAQLGSVDDVIAQITADYALTKVKVKDNNTKKSHNTWKTALLIIGSPVWGSIFISVLAVVFSVWVSLWAVAVSLWAATFALCIGSVAVIVAGVLLLTVGEKGTGLLAISTSLICAGFSILMCLGSFMVSKGMAALTKLLGRATKRCFKRRKS